MSDPRTQPDRARRLQEIQSGFLQRAAQELSELQGVLQDDQGTDTALGVLHRLKGAAGTCGFLELSGHFADAERALRADASREAVDALQEALRAVASPRPESVEALALGAEPRFAKRGRSLLCIEDDPDIAELIRMAGRLDGFEVERAATGDAGWKRLDDGLRPSLVVLDLMLPGLSGFEILSLARAQADVRGIPFLVLSAKSPRDVRERVLEAGASAFLPKPFELDDLSSLLRELVPE